MSEGALLDRIQAQVADRDPVEWHAVDAGSWSPNDLGELELLRLLDAIAVAHTTFPAVEESTPRSSTPYRPPPPRDDDTLQTWGRYRLEEKVGRGGFGSVYRAWDPRLEMPVAIKILHRRLDDADLKERLLREGRALAQVKHPNVVRVLTVEEHDGRLGLVMELLRGETLDALVAARGELNEREAAVIAEDVCRALAAVHANRLIHRDVKARNIIRERSGRIVLMDFGTGRREDPGGDDAGAVGTPIYMAPEVLNGAPATVASDVYSLGVLLFFLVSGRYPYAGGVEGLQTARSTRRKQSLIELRPELPTAFVQVVDRALATDPGQRHATAAAVLHALVNAREKRDWPRRVLRAAGIVLGALVILTLGGLASSVMFNVVLRRTQYSTESPADWFVYGARSVLMPIVLFFLAVWIIGVAAVLRRAFVAASSRMRRADQAVTAWCGNQTERLGLCHAGVTSCWLVLASTVGLAAAWWYWAPLITAVISDVAASPRESLALLSPSFRDYQVGFRMTLAVLAAINLTSWYYLLRTESLREHVIPLYAKASGGAVVVLVLLSMQIPYRVIYHNDIFKAVQWRGEKCYVLGERREDVLVFCPKLTPRHYVITAPAGQLQALPSSANENIFAAFHTALN